MSNWQKVTLLHVLARGGPRQNIWTESKHPARLMLRPALLQLAIDRRVKSEWTSRKSEKLLGNSASLYYTRSNLICVLCAYSRHTVLTFLKIISAVNFLGVPGQKIVWLRQKPCTETLSPVKYDGIWCTLQGCRASNLWQKLICSDKVAVLISKIDYAEWSSQTTVAFR